MKLKLFYMYGGRNPSGEEVLFPVATVEPNSKRYQWYLADNLSTLCRTRKECDDLLELIRKAEGEKGEKFAYGRNDVELHCEGNSVQVNILIDSSLIDNPDGCFPISIFRSALLAWREFLGAPPSLETKNEINFDAALD